MNKRCVCRQLKRYPKRLSDFGPRGQQEMLSKKGKGQTRFLKRPEQRYLSDEIVRNDFGSKLDLELTNISVHADLPVGVSSAAHGPDVCDALSWRPRAGLERVCCVSAFANEHRDTRPWQGSQPDAVAPVISSSDCLRSLTPLAPLRIEVRRDGTMDGGRRCHESGSVRCRLICPSVMAHASAPTNPA